VQPDYSRQTLLKEVGPSGQAKLGSSRVLIVGVGGLGSPVTQYLAGAGVGCLGLVDADSLDASNLHRQPIYSAADIGRSKIALAREAALRINPSIRIESHPVRLSAENALALVSAYDLVVDCSDNFRTKFLINDAAVLARRMAVFASVYQFEGQLQVYKPAPDHGCLRCLWREASADGVVGNCAEAGVLGPVPGVFGSLQALITLKLLLGMAGQLPGELLLMDFTAFSTTKLKAPRRPECVAPDCIHIRRIDSSDSEIELTPLEDANDYELIDIRTDQEIALLPSRGRHIEMSALLANPALLSPDARYLLVCASGKRSLAAARELSGKGFKVRSLRGGLSAIKTIGGSDNVSRPGESDRPAASGTMLVQILRTELDSQVQRADRVAVEAPLEYLLHHPALGMEPVSFGTTMRTPGEDEQLAAGLLFGEGIVNSASDIESIESSTRRPNVVNVRLRAEVQLEMQTATRRFSAGSSCGVCGTTGLDAAIARAAAIRIEDSGAVDMSLILGLPGRMRAAQAKFGDTGGIHAAALFDFSGALVALAEDVGRHNAFDKLVGECLMSSRLPLREHIILLSGRASFELTQKALRSGVSILAAIGAPSSLAVNLALGSGMTLVGFLRERHFNVYSAPQRILAAPR
jgi:formate dehydrogenase accessory protein FdhD